MADKTYKNLFDDGYTTYHDDGTTSKTYRHLLDDGYTTYHEDGSRSDTYHHLLDDGYKTYYDDGSTSDSYHHVFGDGYATFNSDGSRSDTYGNILDDGFTTYHSGGSSAGSSYGGYGNTGYPYGISSAGNFGYSYNGGTPLSTYGSFYRQSGNNKTGGKEKKHKIAKILLAMSLAAFGILSYKQINISQTLNYTGNFEEWVAPFFVVGAATCVCFSIFGYLLGAADWRVEKIYNGFIIAAIIDVILQAYFFVECTGDGGGAFVIPLVGLSFAVISIPFYKLFSLIGEKVG